MASPERNDSIRITWDPDGMILDEFAVFTSFLADLYSEVAAPYVVFEFAGDLQPPEIPASPLVVSVQMNSPFIAELINGSEDVLSVLALGMVGYVLKKPEALGRWIPAVRTAWYEGNRKALLARAEYLQARGDMSTEGPAIERFEIADRERRERAQRRGRAERASSLTTPGRDRRSRGRADSSTSERAGRGRVGPGENNPRRDKSPDRARNITSERDHDDDPRGGYPGRG